MAKKSKKLAAQRSSSTKRKKGKGGLSQRQIELSGVAAPAPAPAPNEVESQPLDSEAEDDEGVVAEPQPIEQPLSAQPVAASASEGPWRYGYVLGEMKRIGILTTVVALLLVVLTFLLR